MNQYDTEALTEAFARYGFEIVDFGEAADAYIINTCTVTHVASQKSRQMIRRAAARNPEAVIAVTGCYSQVSPDEAAAVEHVDIVTGTADRAKLPELVLEKLRRGEAAAAAEADLGADGETDAGMPVSGFKDHTRAFMKIQDGCENFCAYCIIPYARGPIKSRSREDVIAEASRLADAGYREIVLTGIHLASYGRDMNGPDRSDFLDIAHDISKLDGIARIRLGSIEPSTIDARFIEAVAGDPKLCPHFHISLQSGCDATLARMNRKYAAHEYAASVAALRKALPDAAVTTDVMVGFPGETDDEFAQTYEFLRTIKLAKTHIFKYSRRAGTPAAAMAEQVDEAEKKRREDMLIELDRVNRSAFISKFIGRTLPVLIETADDARGSGMTPNYIKVDIDSPGLVRGSITDVRLIKVGADGLIGRAGY